MGDWIISFANNVSRQPPFQDANVAFIKTTSPADKHDNYM